MTPSLPADPVAGDFVDATISAITAIIRDNDLKPGDRLPAEASLSADLQVSRTVVREALRSLAALRLVTLGAGKRAAVAKIDDGAMALMFDHGVVTEQIDILQIYDVRRTLEARTATLAALRRTEAEAQAILQHAHAMQTHFAVPATVMEHDLAFHLAIARASRNPLFALILGSFRNITRRTWPVGWECRDDDAARRAMNDLHIALAEAIAAGDPRNAARLMEQHFDESIKNLLSAGVI